ncbi:MAG: single-stranded-DNA-specific exonuclease RecJ [Aerococcus sp.]|nr:single-stranded-DNA-specific exonuclease RecJ [Aerococcus sp.]
MLKSKYHWQASETNEQAINDETIAALSLTLQQPAFLIRLAIARGYGDEEAIRAYLAEPETFHDPFLLYDMQKLIDRLTHAVEQQEKILVYGDYDADGITSTTILLETLENLGADVTYYLPDRFEDGYGPNQAVYQYYIRQGIQLILTCDNGVSGHEAIAYAKSQGVDVLVTDHHELPDELPDAYAIVHPRHPKGNYPFDDLCGAGVALKVATALMGDLPSELLDLAAIGTVADVVSLRDENRFIVRQGIEQMKRGERLGLALLLEKEGINPNNIDEETIAFIIAPRLNSLGRIKQAGPGVELMTTFDPDVAETIVTEVNATNNERKQIVDKMAADVFQQMDKMSTLPPCLILASEDWHEGVLGIVASRVVETIHRPTILLRYDQEKKNYKGSGRSIEGINLFDVLTQASAYAESWGGHAMAAGMTITSDQYEQWVQAVEEAMSDFQDQLTTQETLVYDLELPIDAFTLENATALEQLKPFGAKQPKPQFLLKNVRLKQVQAIGKDQQTLKLTVANKTGDVPLIGFRMGDLAEPLQGETTVDVIVTMNINEWQGNRQAQGFILDVKSDAVALFDLRQAKNRQEVFNVDHALYVFESEHYLSAYQQVIPETSTGLLMSDWEERQAEISAADYDQLVIFDCVHDQAKLQTMIQELKIKNVYLFAYSHQHAYMIGQPLRQEFATLYQYLTKHPGIELAGNEEAVARYLKLAPAKVKLMLSAFLEGHLIAFDAGHLQIIHPTAQVELAKLPIMKAWQQQIQAERFFLYTDLAHIKAYLFGEIKDE